MLKKHYLHLPGNIQVEFSIEAEVLGQTAIIVKEGFPKQLSVHEVKLHSSVDFPEDMPAVCRSSYLPTLMSLPIILDRLYKLCEDHDVELVEFVYALTPEVMKDLSNHS